MLFEDENNKTAGLVSTNKKMHNNSQNIAYYNENNGYRRRFLKTAQSRDFTHACTNCTCLQKHTF